MSTWAPHQITCPGCGQGHEVHLLKGMHITRLPEVRDQIVDGTFQIAACPHCGHTVGIERPTIYTDFQKKTYVALEVDGTADIALARERHRKIFDECFLLGPDIASELASGMTHRLVFGVRALREKVIAWEAGLDDRAVEGAKLLALSRLDLDPRAVQLRLLLVQPLGGHLLFGAYPVHRREAPPLGQRTVPNDPALTHTTVLRADYDAILGDLQQLQGEVPWIFDDWLVDASLGAPA